MREVIGDAPDASDRFVPARRTRGLTGTVPGTDVNGPCRPDALGNLRCR